jgi:hypothetical protein
LLIASRLSAPFAFLSTKQITQGNNVPKLPQAGIPMEITNAFKKPTKGLQEMVLLLSAHV